MDGPLISAFTPAHDVAFLAETHQSLVAQDYGRFEWVILLNGEAKTEQVPLVIRQDPRVRIIEHKLPESRIGALKLAAITHCRGSLLLEMDYDDVLVPGTLGKVVAAYQSGAGFIYSDVAVFEDPDLVSWGYSPDYGWAHYPITVYGLRFIATRCFPLTPRMLCEVHYAPDHVRVWSRQAYFQAGGHDPNLAVGDDHDLICRTYLSGTKFSHIGSCGYLYRRHSSNTVARRNQAIQQQQADNRRKYLQPLIEEWCRREHHPVLDLLKQHQAGAWSPHNPTFLDHAYGVENHYGQIIAGDVLQLLKPADQDAFFNAAYRALLPGGYLSVTVPSANGWYADQDPRFASRFNPNSFLYYSNRRFAQNRPSIKCRFDLIQCHEYYPDTNFERHNMLLLRADLAALKDQHHPGKQEI